MPTLFVVATPIGNLEDITLRALRTLREVKLIAAEDTRKTRKLLTHYDIKTPMTSYHEHNKRAKLNYILNYLNDADVAIVSEAGMPGMSDPGYDLIVAAQEKSIPVVPIPGPSAVITALVVSGLPADRFTYIGFLPNKTKARLELLKSVASESGTIVAFEAPHRLKASLEDIQQALGDRQIAVCREMTKLHEEILRTSLGEARQHFEAVEPRGEFTLVVGGATGETAWNEARVRSAIAKRLSEGLSRAEAARQVSSISGWERRRVYRLAMEVE